ncbi:hypothetical protein [Bradyrhizobium sp. SYSU BS000235]
MLLPAGADALDTGAVCLRHDLHPTSAGWLNSQEGNEPKTRGASQNNGGK